MAFCFTLWTKHWNKDKETWIMKRYFCLVAAAVLMSMPLGALPRTFKGKTPVVRSGMVNVYGADGKVYVELPLSLLGRRMLMGTTVTKCSNPMESSAGYCPAPPKMVCFERSDSSVFLCAVNDGYVSVDGSADDALHDSNVPSIMEAFRIKEFTLDSTSVLIDVTSFAKRDDKSVNPIDPKAYNGADGYVLRSRTHIPSATFISGFDSFADNFSVSASHSYKLKASFLGIFSSDENTYFTAEVKRCFLLLPDTPMAPKKADLRIGTDKVSVNEMSAGQSGVRKVGYATRWRLSADSTGHVANPVVFYIDDAFPAGWIRYVEDAVDAWNEAFERIGYRNAVQHRVFPDDDPEFDPGNMKYSCIRYNFSLSDRIYDSKYCDPRTGEIIAAGIYVNHGICESIRRDLMLQTAAGCEHARKATLSDELFGKVLFSKMMRHVGHCLGLKDNMAASCAYPSDSLKSASFTEKNGIASSVMDELPYNFIAYSSELISGKEDGTLPEIVQERLGPYDFHTVEWLYGKDNFNDASTDLYSPLYRYGKRQSSKAFYDPRAMALDLGDNSLESAEYAFVGLANVIAGIDGWAEEFDEDYSLRSGLQEPVILQAYEYIKQVFVPVGGIYVNEKYDGDDVEAYAAVPKEIQRRHLLWALRKIDDLSFLDNGELESNMSLTGSTAEYCSKYFSNFVFIQIAAMWKSEKCTDDPYTQIDAMEDVRDHIWRGARAGAEPTDLQKFQQGLYVDCLIAWSDIAGAAKEDSRVPYSPDRSHVWYKMLLETQKFLDAASSASSSEELKGHYGYLSYRIRSAMKR